jgi:hypothetical protein
MTTNQPVHPNLSLSVCCIYFLVTSNTVLEDPILAEPLFTIDSSLGADSFRRLAEVLVMKRLISPMPTLRICRASRPNFGLSDGSTKWKLMITSTCRWFGNLDRKDGEDLMVILLDAISLGCTETHITNLIHLRESKPMALMHLSEHAFASGD